MEKIFQFFISKWRVSITLASLIIFMGLDGLKQLNSETYPPVNLATAIITTIYPGASSDEVAENVTQTIEEEIRTVDGIKDVKSISQAGRSTIIIRVDLDNIDVKETMDELEAALAKVNDLPSGILNKPEFIEVKSTEIPIIKLALIGKNQSRIRDKWADLIKDELEKDKGVSEVNLNGFAEAEFHILLDKHKLKQLNVGIAEVLNAIQKRTQDIPAGYIKNEGNQKLVRVKGKGKDVTVFEEIVIRSNFTGQNIKVKDVANVLALHEDHLIKTSMDKKEATLLTVNKKTSADAIALVQRLQSKIEKIKAQLPKDLNLIQYDDESQRISNQMNIVVGNALGGLVLVIILLLLFLPGSVGVVTAISLPLSVLVTVGLMPILNVNFNTITMLALVISIGMLVDNSIVISENYTRLREEGNDPLQSAFLAVHQFWLPITATAFTTIAAFLPMLVTKGVMGQFIKYIPIVVSIALFASLVESFILLPARLRFTMTKTVHKQAESKGFKSFQIIFEKVMKVLIHHRYITFFSISSLLLTSLLVAAYGNRFELFPSEDVEYYVVKFESDLSNTLDKTQDIGIKIINEIEKTLGEGVYENIILEVGSSKIDGMDGNATYGDHVGIIRVKIPIEVAKNQVAEDVKKSLRTISVEGVSKITIAALAAGPPVGNALEITLMNNNFNELQNAVEILKAKLSEHKGVLDISDNDNPGAKEVSFDINYNKLSSLGLSIEDVGISLRSVLQGSIASKVNIDGNEVAIRIRYNDDDRRNTKNIEQTAIMNSRGNLIPISQFARIKEVDGPSTRLRYNFQRAITVFADVDNQNMTAVKLNSLAASYAEELSKSSQGLSYTFLGSAESTNESVESLANAMLIAILCILVLLVLLFDSFIQPFIVLSTIPLGLVGVSTAFYLHAKPLSFMALIGVVGLAGVVINSAIVLISFIKELELNSKLERTEMLAKATSLRLRAVLVTTLTTVCGLLPTAYGIGGYDPILVPLTLALAWGLVSGTVLTLIWVPCCVAITDDINSMFSRWFGGEADGKSN